jgi:hypothetical protein
VPIYEQLIGELLTDPVLVSRELDELLIKWWAQWQQPGSTRRL